MQEGVKYPADQEIKKDLMWWKRYLAHNNGVSMMWMFQKLELNEFFSTDACLDGAGGMCQGCYYHAQFPEKVFHWDKKVHIGYLELLAVIIGVKIWKDLITGTRFVVGCDNQAVVTIVNTGRSRNMLLQRLLRELNFELAKIQAQIYLRFVQGSENILPDILFRWYTDSKYRQQFEQLKEETWQETVVLENVFNIQSDW